MNSLYRWWLNQTHRIESKSLLRLLDLFDSFVSLSSISTYLSLEIKSQMNNKRLKNRRRKTVYNRHKLELVAKIIHH